MRDYDEGEEQEKCIVESLLYQLITWPKVCQVKDRSLPQVGYTPITKQQAVSWWKDSGWFFASTTILGGWSDKGIQGAL